MNSLTKTLCFKDAKTQETIFTGMAEFHENENYWAMIDVTAPAYLTYEFMIECAIYGINEGQTHFGSYDNDDDQPLAFWALVDRAI